MGLDKFSGTGTDLSGVDFGAAAEADFKAQCLAALADNTYKRQAGVAQEFATTIDLHQAAASYDLATATTADCLIEGVTIRLPNIDVSDDAAITSISIQTDDTTAQTFISSTSGAKANLDAEAQLAWVGSCLLDTGAKIQLTIAGGTATADPTTCQVVIMFRAVTAGGYLA